MQKEILQRLNLARQEKQAVVLITDLSSGEQSLHFLSGLTIGSELTVGQKETSIKVLENNKSHSQKKDGTELFFNPFNPPLRMVVIGAVHISQPLASLARLCNYQVTIVDPRQAFATEKRFPNTELIAEWPDKALTKLELDLRTAVVALTHDPKLDDPALKIALQSDAFYIGELGSHKTQEARKNRLREDGFTDQQQQRIHGPIGLNIGAQSPVEIAVAIIGQITQTLHRRKD